MAGLRLRTRLFLTAMAVSWMLGSNDGRAQVSTYQPSSPTLSPYLNLSRFNTGGLPNYHALVRPQIQQRLLNVQEQTLVRRQGRELLRLQDELQSVRVAPSPTGTASWFMVPGQQVRFLSTSQYFPEQAVGRGRP